MVANIGSRPSGVAAKLGGKGPGDILTPGGALPLSALPADAGFTPLDLLDAALAGCLALSLRFAARQRGWSSRLVSVDVRVAHAKATEASAIAAFTCRFDIAGDFTADERRLLVADAHAVCTVSNSLAAGTAIVDEVC